MQDIYILIVDDQPENLIAMDKILRELDVQIIKAKSGYEALRAVLDYDLAVVIMDVCMPGLNGFETAELIHGRAANKNLPVIFVTAGDRTEERQWEGYRTGAVDFLSKPLEPLVLLSKVRVFVELAKHQRQLQSRLLEIEALQNELQMERRRLNLAVDAAQLGIFSWDAKTRKFTWSKITESICGFAPGSMGTLFRDCLRLVHPEDRAQCLILARCAEPCCTCKQMELRILRADGQTRWIRVFCDARPHPKTTFIGSIIDISERKEAELAIRNSERHFRSLAEERETARLEAAKANEAKSQFLANMSHEIRTPLSAISGFAHLLTLDDISKDDQYQYAEIILQSSASLAELINDILDLSKVEAGKLSVRMRPVKLDELLGEILAIFSEKAAAKKIELSYAIANNTPEIIHTDPERLRQILINIIGNALKFTDQGQIFVSVCLNDLDQDGEEIIFSVRDSGPGIHPEQVARLFQAFSQGDDSISRAHGGTGLGLVLSRQMAKLLGGGVTLKETTPGVGSEFQITIVSSGMEMHSPEQMQSIPSREGRTYNFAGFSMLVIDDNGANRRYLSEVLEQKGAMVTQAISGQEGCILAQTNNYDLILMDIRMPGMSGYDAISFLRSNGYSKPVVAITAHAMQGERQRCLEAGFDEQLIKPISPTDLVEQVAFILQRKPFSGEEQFKYQASPQKNASRGVNCTHLGN